mgnify:CR=1 FL=1|jgi:altronate dehydratase large subunit
MKFLGYQREDGTVGIRNKILVIALSDCCEPIARQIAQTANEAVAITQHYGCINDPIILNTLIGVATNPNISAVVVVIMGCEGINTSEFIDSVNKSGKPLQSVIVQEIGGTSKAIKKGCEFVKEFQDLISSQARIETDLSKLVIGVKCGGSDATNGIAGNPAVGIASDYLIDAGGVVILSEPIEALGAESYLMDRAINDDVKKDIKKVIMDEFRRSNVDDSMTEVMCKGNYLGGLSSIEEKALGAVLKSGSRDILGVLKVNSKVIEKPEINTGVYFQDGTHVEPMAMTLMAAAGAQLVVYVSGRGGTLGHAVVPFINVNGNPNTCKTMQDDIDICAGGIITGNESLSSVGGDIFTKIKQVSSGEITKSEINGYDNFSVFTRDQRLERLLGINS